MSNLKKSFLLLTLLTMHSVCIFSSEAQQDASFLLPGSVNCQDAKKQSTSGVNNIRTIHIKSLMFDGKNPRFQQLHYLYADTSSLYDTGKKFEILRDTFFRRADRQSHDVVVWREGMPEGLGFICSRLVPKSDVFTNVKCVKLSKFSNL